MNALVTLISAAALAATPYTVDLTRYFPNQAAEQADRATVLANVAAFEAQTAAGLATPTAFAGWLGTYDSLSKNLQKHDAYVYLRAEANHDDRADATTDEVLGGALLQLDAAVQGTLDDLGPTTVRRLLREDPELARYAHFVDDGLMRAAHESKGREAVTLLARPALDSLANAYKTLRQHALAQPPAAGPAGETKYGARWTPYLRDEDAFAALLLPVVSLQNGKAKIQGFTGAPEGAYFQAGLSVAEVDAVLTAVKDSDAQTRYQSMVAEAAAKRLHIASSEVKVWNLDAANDFSPPLVSFPDAAPIILLAERPMGAEYARQYARLFDPTAHRVQWCHETQCDDAGFSVGFAGLTSGVFYGNYQGTPESMRAVAHEAGHAVHRQLMSENQPLAVYNRGPKFIFESVAIFNELLFLEHLYRSAPSPAAKAYYLRKWLDDVVFQIYGSARETDLEESIYAGALAGNIRTASDLDTLTLRVFASYQGASLIEPMMKVDWARNRLYFTDPLYDVNYLFAGLLALEYWQQFENDPRGFPPRYLAFLKGGFTDTPQALERKTLGIELEDGAALVDNAASMIKRRTAELSKLYSAVVP
jgi:oligoendopeptidase F